MGRRHAYWFPLVLLGFGLLALLGWENAGPGQDFGWFAYEPLDEISLSNTVYVAYYQVTPYPSRGAVWAWLVVVALVGTAAWYAWQARRAGEPVRPYVTAGIAGAAAVGACYLSAAVAGSADNTGVVTTVGLPLLGLAVVAGVWAYLRRGSAWRPPAMLGLGCVAVGLGVTLGDWAPGLVDPVLIAAGLLVLARLERSRLVAVAAGAALIAWIVVPTGVFTTLLPAALLLLAGVAALVTRHEPGESPVSS